MSKLDYKKKYPKYYKPSSKEPVILKIGKMNFFMIDGKGLDPSDMKDYEDAIECLYAVSYALKMKIVKREDPSKDYVVPPLEGLWHMDDMTQWSMENKKDWLWTMMIRIPDYVTKTQIDKSIEIAKETKNPVSLSKLYVQELHEKEVVQLLHIGPYFEEGPNIQRMHKFAMDQGFDLIGKHHEIYLGDPRKTDPAKLKTVLRQPITKK